MTRAAEDAGLLAELLVAAGAQPVFFPTIERRPPEDVSALRSRWAEIEAYDRVLVGSFSALEPFLALPRPSAPIPAACVGAATAERVRAFAEGWFEVAEVAQERRAEGLVSALEAGCRKQGGLRGRRFLFPRAPQGRTALIDLLESRGAQVDAVSTYEIACRDPLPEVPSALTSADVFTFLSGQTLACFLRVVGSEGARACLAEAQVAVIGPVAAERAEALGVRVDVVPPDASARALVEALDAARAR